ncbi:MAG: ribosomal protein L3 N(5)-glutamine methyltransferase [Betaproteobacteria bacterium RIFCSPLOWO2_12_FULL_64_23]|nr:MAG: ribosomal protein L3 N(5)-glutamine methyltransferase [Betaproteobacteria bacterium RIFCSPLOWO2_12_FULL_64_23]
MSPARDRPLTLRAVLREAVTQFKRAGLAFGHGTNNARDEAVYLILHTLKLPLGELDGVLERQLSASELLDVRAILRRRVQERMPAAYLTREAWLGEFRFYVDERAIVPRSFIAELLHRGLAPWVGDARRVRGVLDLCTGSGCLAVLAAHAFPEARIDAADLSAAALQVARRNVKDYALGERVRLVQTDLFDRLAARRYDLILSNPPYVNAGAMRALPREYRHEPRLALAGGRDGLALVRRMLAQAAAHLRPEGLLVVEIGHNRAALEQAYAHLPFTWLETSAGDDYVFMLRREELL